MSNTQAQVQHHALPGWFVWFQDHIGLSLLIVALMTINGVVYGSGVVQSIEQPGTWGIFGTIMFVAFFAAGTAMPGVALRAGAGIFAGEWYRRLACLLVAVVFFALEVWCSVTERSVTTSLSPADKWLLAAIGHPELPVSPTVLVISVALSLVVVVWGLVTGVSALESAEEAAQREHLKTIKAQAKAERRAIFAASLGSAGRAALDAAKDRVTTDANTVQSPDEGDAQTPGDAPDKAPALTRRQAPGKAVPSHMMSAPQFRAYLRENGVRIQPEQAVMAVKSVPGWVKSGTTYYAPRRALMPVANRLIQSAQASGSAEQDAGALAG